MKHRPARPLATLTEPLESRRLLTALPDGFTDTVVAQNFGLPTAMDVLPDGRVLIAAQDGRLQVVKNGALQSQPFVTVSVDYDGERGMVVDADNDGHVDILLLGSERWNCNNLTGGPVTCNGAMMLLSGADHNWAPGPKIHNQMAYRPTTVTSDAHILYDGSVRRDYRQQIQQGIVVDPRTYETDTFTYTASDAGGTSSPATVSIALKPLNRPPVITSIAPTAHLELAPDYPRRLYTITAYDPDPGDTVHFELVSHNYNTYYFPPPLVDPVTGTVDVYSGSCGSYGGPCNFGQLMIIVAAIDSHGARTEQVVRFDSSSFTVAVPDVVGQLVAAAKTTLEAAQLTPLVVTQVFAPQPAGTVVAQSPIAGTANVPRSETVKLTLSKGPQPVAVPFVVGNDLGQATRTLAAVGLSAAATPVASDTIPVKQVMTQSPAAGTIVTPGAASPVALTVSSGPALSKPVTQVIVEPGPTTRVVGDDVTYKATAVFNDGTSADVTLSAIWTSSLTAAATIDSVGMAHAAGGGTTSIKASLGAVFGTSSLEVRTRTSTDVTPPTAIITAPVSNSTVAGALTVTGTASDTNFLRYELAYSVAGSDSWTTIADSGTPVTAGTLGTFDPTLLVNDLYTLRLTVLDRGGNEAVALSTVQVKGERKIGYFSLSYTDLQIPMSGIPITILRTYDSRDKAKGDFGIGWRLGLDTMRLRTNRVPGTGWVRNVSGINVSLAATDEHKVSLTLEDGRVEEFDMVVSPTSNVGSLDNTSVTAYVARPGTQGSLQALGNTSLLIVSGGSEDELVDDSTLATYNPQQYLYTARNGLQLTFDRDKGIVRMADRSGNVLTFGDNGIVHSGGKSVTFTRDLQGRITRITDPLGNAHIYTYDGNGDLVTHASPVGDTSRYAYDRFHAMLQALDPSGGQPVRNEYDAAGRMTATTDANGNRVEIAHNAGVSQEVVRDRLGNPTIHSYDANGNVLSTLDAMGGTTTYTYDARGNMLSQTDQVGRTATKTYDAADNLLTRTDFEGNTTTWTYDSKNQVLTTTDPEGRTTTNVYDAAGNLVQVTDPEGGITRSTYNAAGKPLTVTDPLNNVTTYTYDGAGNRLTQTDPLGRTRSYAYDANNRLVSLTFPDGKAELSQYDETGRVIALTDRGGNVSRITYSPIGDGTKIASRTDPLGRVTSYEYDAGGRQVKRTFPDGSTELVVYDAESRVLSATNRDGNATTSQYDALGRRTRIVAPGGAAKVTAWDAAGRVVSETDERGNVTTIAYGPNQQTTTDALGNVTVTRFDSRRQKTKFTDALGRVTQYAYDSAGNRTKTTFADGTIATTAFDAAKRKTSETDQAGRSTAFAYDAAGQLVTVTDAAGAVTTYAYDTVGNRTSQTDALGRVTQLAWDAVSRLSRRTRPSGRHEDFAYDAVGNRVSQTDFNGQTITYAFDAANREVQRTLPGGATIASAWTGSGLRTKAGGDTTGYDNRGRIVSEGKASGDALSYTWDASGNRASMTTPQGNTTYTYDALNRLATVVDGSGTTTYAYDSAGNVSSIAHPNGTTVAYVYDTLNRLTRVTNTGPGGLISSYAYTLGAAGNRTQVVESGPATQSRTVTYTYDAVYRLTREQIVQAATPTSTIDYVYDAAGNRTRMTRDAVVTNYAYDTSDRLLSETTGASVVISTWDDNGNLLSRSGGSGGSAGSGLYSYDAENRLVAATTATDSLLYGYDADGQRTSRTLNGTTTTYLLDKTGLGAACCAAAAAQFAQVLVEKTGASVVAYGYGLGLLHSTRTGTGLRVILADGQMSTRQLADTAGAVTDTATFDAFGVLLASSGTTPNDVLYAGEHLDANVGHYYLRARWYSPATGRFLSSDPEQGNPFDPVTLHRYLYTGNSPVDRRDPSGRDFSLPSLTMAQAISASTRLGTAASLLHYALTGARSISESLTVGAMVTAGAIVVMGGYAFAIGTEIAAAGSAGLIGGAGGAQASTLYGALHAMRTVVVATGEQEASAQLGIAVRLFGNFVQGVLRTPYARCVLIKNLAILVPMWLSSGILPAAGGYAKEVLGTGAASAMEGLLPKIIGGETGLLATFACK